MRDLLLGFKFALSYFTNIPVKSFKEDEDVTKKEVLSFLVTTLPFVGLILGTLTILTFLLFDSIPILACILASCVYFILYGFLHTEAILDVVDAIYARHSGKDAYKIIKESTVGALGVLYSIICVILKISAMGYLLLNGHLLEVLFVITFSRFTTGFNLYFFEFKSSFLTMLKESINLKHFYISLAILTIIFIVLIGMKAFYLAFFMVIIALFIINYIKKALGFLNGDALGMTLELTEIITLFALCYLTL